MLLKLARTIAPLHTMNPPIVHRDLKPANVLVVRTADGKINLKIGDFGIGGLATKQAIEGQSKGASQGEILTQTLRGSHTPLYAGPEQQRGDPPHPTDDVHALGVIGFQLLVCDLRRGPTGDWDEELRELGVSDPIIAMFKQCIARQARRYPHAGALADELQNLIDSKPSTAAKPALPVPPVPAVIQVNPFEEAAAIPAPVTSKSTRRQTTKKENAQSSKNSGNYLVITAIMMAVAAVAIALLISNTFFTSKTASKPEVVKIPSKPATDDIGGLVKSIDKMTDQIIIQTKQRNMQTDYLPEKSNALPTPIPITASKAKTVKTESDKSPLIPEKKALTTPKMELSKQDDNNTSNTTPNNTAPILRISPIGFTSRSSAIKKATLIARGGSVDSEISVARGLRWIANHQLQDGSWALDAAGLKAGETGAGKRDSRIAGTAFGLLPLLGYGITHKLDSEKVEDQDFSGKLTLRSYHSHVKKGLDYLISIQDKATGAYSTEPYSHAMATIVMCEAAGMTFDSKIQESAQKAIQYIIYFQDPIGGGWRYSPKMPGDTSVTGWMFMALKSGQIAGLRVPSERVALANQFLNSVIINGSEGIYGYQVGDIGGSPTVTAIGMLCRQYLGTHQSNTLLRNGADLLKKNDPATQINNSYYLYYATQAMYHMGSQDDCWLTWNLGPNKDGKGGIRDLLIDKQIGGPRSPSNTSFMSGSWTPSGRGFTQDGGRLMETSLSILDLEIYYRYNPLK
jgi:serine/threonine protein kinase